MESATGKLLERTREAVPDLVRHLLLRCRPWNSGCGSPRYIPAQLEAPSYDTLGDGSIRAYLAPCGRIAGELSSALKECPTDNWFYYRCPRALSARLLYWRTTTLAVKWRNGLTARWRRRA